MVLVEIAKAKGLSSLRIRKIKEVKNRERISSPNMMIPLYVINMIRDTLISV